MRSNLLMKLILLMLVVKASSGAADPVDHTNDRSTPTHYPSTQLRSSMSLAQIASKLDASVVQVVQISPDGKSQSMGTGFWINPWHVVTCFHVVSNLGWITAVNSPLDDVVTITNGQATGSYSNFESHRAVVTATDKINDLAILEVSDNPFGPKRRNVYPMITRDRSGHIVGLAGHFAVAGVDLVMPKQGDPVYLVGFPLGLSQVVVQHGNYNSLNIHDYGRPFLILSEDANHGNSGGPVFDQRGGVIGVLSNGLPDPNGIPVGAPAAGLSRAVPSQFVVDLFRKEALLKHGEKSLTRLP